MTFRPAPTGSVTSTFYETWPTPVGGYSIDAANNDLRTTLPHYQLVRQRLALAVTDPFINPDTGHPVIALGYPILVKDNFVGVASAHNHVSGLSELLARHKASANASPSLPTNMASCWPTRCR